MGFPERYALNTPAIDVNRLPRALSPVLVWVARMVLLLLVSALSLCVLVTSILVVKWYNDHEPIVKPSWGSLIFLVVLSLLTPIIYAGYEAGLPLMPFVQPGDILYDCLSVKIEILLQLAMCILWVSGTLAYFEDLGGRDACEFDSYYHYAQPADFERVCDLRDLVWPFAFSVFAVQVLSFLLELVAAAYTFLFLDQEVLNEPHWAWGRRAYDWQRGRRATRAETRAARASRVSGKEAGYDGYPGLHSELFGPPPPVGSSFFPDPRAPREISGESDIDDASSSSHSRPSFRRGGAYSAGTPSETGTFPRRGGAYSVGTPSESGMFPRRGGAYSVGTPSEPSVAEASAPRRGGAYSVGTPSEASLDSVHEAGPYLGSEEPAGFASNQERGYAQSSVGSDAWSSGSAHLQGEGTNPHRRGPAYVEDDEALPALGSRGRRAYLDED